MRMFCGNHRWLRSVAAAFPVGCSLYAASVFVSSQFGMLPVNIWGANYGVIFGVLLVLSLLSYSASLIRCPLSGKEALAFAFSAALLLLFYAFFTWLNTSLTTGDSLQMLHPQFGYGIIRGDRMFNRTLALLGALAGVDRYLFALHPLGGICLLFLTGEMIFHEAGLGRESRLWAVCVALVGMTLVASTHMTRIQFFYINNHMWVAVIVLLAVSLLLDAGDDQAEGNTGFAWGITGGGFLVSLLGFLRLDGPLFGLVIVAVMLGRASVRSALRVKGAFVYALFATPLLGYMVWLDSGKVGAWEYLVILFATWLLVLFFFIRMPERLASLQQQTGLFSCLAGLLGLIVLLVVRADDTTQNLDFFKSNTFAVSTWGYSMHYLVFCSVAVLVGLCCGSMDKHDRGRERMRSLGYLVLCSVFVILLLTPFERIRLRWSNSHNRMLFHFFPLAVVWSVVHVGRMVDLGQLGLVRIRGSAARLLMTHRQLLPLGCSILLGLLSCMVVHLYGDVLLQDIHASMPQSVNMPEALFGISTAFFDSFGERMLLHVSGGALPLLMSAAFLAVYMMILSGVVLLTGNSSGEKAQYSVLFCLLPLFWIAQHEVFLGVTTSVWASLACLLVGLGVWFLCVKDYVLAKRLWYSGISILFAFLVLHAGFRSDSIPRDVYGVFVSTALFPLVAYGVLRGLRFGAVKTCRWFPFFMVLGWGLVVAALLRGGSPRFILSAGMLLFPAGVMGAAFCGNELARFFFPKKKQALFLLLYGFMLASLMLVSWRAMYLERDQVTWQASQLRKMLNDIIQPPYVFDVPDLEYRSMIARLFPGDDAVFLTNVLTIGSHTMDATKDVDESLVEISRAVIEKITRNMVFTYGDKGVLERLWLDRTVKAGLRDTSLEMAPFGRRFDDVVYQVSPWTNLVFETVLPHVDANERVLLGFDLYRLWDYPVRTTCTLFFNDVALPVAVSNHFQWVELPAGSHANRLRFTSDAGLPSEPYIQQYRLNDPIHIQLGADGDYWYRSFLSDDFSQYSMVHTHYAKLSDKGSVSLPIYADESQAVFARLTFGHRTNERSSQGGNYLTLASDAVNVEPVSVALPEGRMPKDVSVPLGYGSGTLAMAQLDLVTSLPSFDSQQNLMVSGKATRYAYVPLHDIWILSLPRQLPAKYTLTAEINYDPWMEGFYGFEHVDEIPFRWSKPHAQIVLPPAALAGYYDAIVTTFSPRPENKPADPRWLWNGVEQYPTHVEVSEDGNTLSFYFENLNSSDGSSNILSIVSQEWIPDRDSGIPDMRSLGIGFVELDLKLAREK